MKKESEKLYDGITDIWDEHVEYARTYQLKKRGSGKRKWWTAAVAAVVAVAIVAGVVFLPGRTPTDSLSGTPSQNPTGDPSGTPTMTPGRNPAAALAYTLAVAEYPEMAAFPREENYRSEEEYDEAYHAWSEGQRERRALRGSADGLADFFNATAGQFLSGAEGDNVVYSPLNVYLALSMLAELTDGNTRRQILDLLGSGSIEALRSQANDVWLANYIDDGAASSILASSLWLNEDVTFHQSTMDTLAEAYYASSYQGKMGDPDFDKALQDWLNGQTGGLLEEQAGQITMDRDTILALATTIYFQGKWGDEFSPDQTAAGVFHAATGDMTCDFMHQRRSGSYYWGDKFSAVSKGMDHAGTMYFILPDEGVSVDELLADGQVMEFLLDRYGWENYSYPIVNLSVPKFDVTSQLDLVENLKALGVTDVFSRELGVADFSPMTSDVDGAIFAAEVRHDARVTIDEEGCTAVAYTYIMVGNDSVPMDEVDFVLDRPFLFAIIGDSGAPLFIGIVNRPVS